MKKVFICSTFILFIIANLHSATYSNIVGHTLQNNGNGTHTITFVICANTSPGEGVGVEANYNTNIYVKSVNNVTFISNGQTCSGGPGSHFSVQITLNSSITNISFQSFVSDFGTLNNQEAFSGFNYNIGVLPVEFEDFEIVNLENTNLLTWQTHSETNHSHYEVERSSNAQNWLSISKVTADLTRSSLKTYEYLDVQPLFGRNYYRIKQVDLDGTISFSEIRSVHLNPEKDKLIVFPNPSIDKLIKIEFYCKNENIGQLHIHNQFGQCLFTKNINNKSIDESINLNSFSSGIYLLSIYDAKGEFIQLKKLVLQ